MIRVWRVALSALLASSGLTLLTSVTQPARAATITPRQPTQVVVYDRQTGSTTLVSHDTAGRPGNASSRHASISADGSSIAFESDAALTPDDRDGTTDVDLWTAASGAVQRISATPGGGQADGPSTEPSISGTGAIVAFTSSATNLTADPGQSPNVSQVFAWQAAGGSISLVSLAAGGDAGSRASGDPAISEDGRVVAFDSDATKLVGGDSNGVTDVFLRNLGRGATIRASLDATGHQVGVASQRPSLSGDGGAVAFDSESPGLVANDSNGARDVFVRDLPPAVQVSPNPLDFGIVPLGTPASLAVTVTSIGWTPAIFQPSAIGGTNAGDFALAGDTCAGQSIDTGGSCTIAVLDVPAASGARTATLTITDSALDSPQLVTLLGGVAAPQLRLDPPVGPPGIVTRLTGSGFPPGGLVSVKWDLGITQALSPTVVGPDGSFGIEILVFHNDTIGPRNLLVTPASGGPTFTPASVPFLVVPATLNPSGAGAIVYAAPEVSILDRH